MATFIDVSFGMYLLCALLGSSNFTIYIKMVYSINLLPNALIKKKISYGHANLQKG